MRKFKSSTIHVFALSTFVISCCATADLRGQAVATTQPATQPTTLPTRPTVMDPAKQESLTEVTGVQNLFAQATDAALSRNGLSSLANFFANSPAASASDGTPAVLPSDATTRPTTNPALPANVDVTALNQTIDQFNREWKQKYGRDFRITDPQLVFADVTATDILSGPVQIAAGHVPGRIGPTTSQVTTAPAAVTTAPASDEEANVNVPPVQGSSAITIRVVRLSPGSFKFASTGLVDQKRLAVSLQAHIRSAMDQNTRWPIDGAQGQRFVTQYVLMALSKACDGADDVAHSNPLQMPATTQATAVPNSVVPVAVPVIEQ